MLYFILAIFLVSFSGHSIDKIISKYTDVDLHWLITGEKKYAINEESNKVSEPSNEPDFKAKYHQCTENYMKLNQEVIALRSENKLLKEKKQ
tara:strand:+ start:693 stop:968 length:276 start_codon:yes stop_codon:yes gene_type:complete